MMTAPSRTPCLSLETITRDTQKFRSWPQPISVWRDPAPRCSHAIGKGGTVGLVFSGYVDARGDRAAALGGEDYDTDPLIDPMTEERRPTGQTDGKIDGNECLAGARLAHR